jgi:hypothetical protein
LLATALKKVALKTGTLSGADGSGTSFLRRSNAFCKRAAVPAKGDSAAPGTLLCVAYCVHT